MHVTSFHVFRELKAGGENLKKIQNMNNDTSRLLRSVYRTKPRQTKIDP